MSTERPSSDRLFHAGMAWLLVPPLLYDLLGSGRGAARSSIPTGQHPMKSIKSYPTRVEADLARIALEAVDIPAVVIGIGLGMEGGSEGVQLLVPDELVKEALSVLGDT